MPSVRVNKELNEGLYFLTFTVKNWYYLFDRFGRWNILLESLKFCQQKKGLKIYSWVFMINHLHLLVFSEDVIGFARDFKRFTSGEFRKNILTHEPNVLDIFRGKDTGDYKFWHKTNMPELIESDKFFGQKKNYIEDNPVRRLYVQKAEDWI